MLPEQRSVADPFRSSGPSNHKGLARAVREILAAKNLTLYRVAALSRARFPDKPSYHIRRNFYFELRSGVSPTFYQILALSELTGYRVRSWLRLFGFSLDAVPRLQATLTRSRTGLIDSSLASHELLLPRLRFRAGQRQLDDCHGSGGLSKTACGYVADE